MSFSLKKKRRWFSSLPIVERTTVFLLSMLFLGSVMKSGYFTMHYGGTDLRARVVGARLLKSDHSPYFYKWTPGDPETILDPNNVNSYTNGVSVAPGVLYLQSIFNSFNYQTIRIIWTVLQYIVALYIFSYVLTRSFKRETDRVHTMVVGVIFFLCSDIWFLNIERGQIYILYAFVFCLLLHLYEAGKWWTFFFSGLILVVAIYCRPTFAVVLIPFIPNLKKGFIIGALVGALVLGVHAILNFQIWNDYFSAMSIYTGFEHRMPLSDTEITIFPSIIEGCKNLTLYWDSYRVGGIYPIHHFLEKYYIIPKSFYLFLYLLIAGLLIFPFRKKLQHFEAEKILLFGFLLYIITEYIIPANRAGYNVVQWVLPVLMMLRRTRLNQIEFVVILCGLFLLIAFPYRFVFCYYLGELALLFCLLRYLNKEMNAKDREKLV